MEDIRIVEKVVPHLFNDRINMRNFDYEDNDEFRHEVDRFFDDEGEFLDEEGYKEELLHAMQLEIEENNLNLKLLQTSIKMLEKSIWWRFYSFKTKLRMIGKAYMVFDKLLIEVKEKDKKNADV